MSGNHYVWSPCLYFDLLIDVLEVGDVIENIPYSEVWRLLGLLDQKFKEVNFLLNGSNFIVFGLKEKEPLKGFYEG